MRISGGNDKQGFPMKQGVLTNGRVRLLLSKGNTCYRARRSGERKRRSVHGCIVDSDLSVLNLVIIKKGDNEILGLTDNVIPRRLGPKRVGKIRKLYNLTKEDDVRQHVIRREIPTPEGKPERKNPKTKAPKIQRLITPQRLQRKRRLIALKIKRMEAARRNEAEYKKMIAKQRKERKEVSQEQKEKKERKEKTT